MELNELKKHIDTMIKSCMADAPTTKEYKQSVLNTLNLWNSLSLCGKLYDFDTYARISHYIVRKMNEYISKDY